jgi:dCMP deaminase
MRPSPDEYGLRFAEHAATRATCLRRAVGCALFNARKQLLATGYNGRAAGLPHCNEADFLASPGPLIYPNACAGAQAPSGTMLDACEAIHAEQNALLQCRDVYAIETCYVTVSPCITCVKLLMNTSCSRIVFRSRYTQDDEAYKLWMGRGACTWIKLDE